MKGFKRTYFGNIIRFDISFGTIYEGLNPSGLTIRINKIPNSKRIYVFGDKKDSLLGVVVNELDDSLE